MDLAFCPSVLAAIETNIAANFCEDECKPHGWRCSDPKGKQTGPFRGSGRPGVSGSFGVCVMLGITAEGTEGPAFSDKDAVAYCHDLQLRWSS